MGEEEREPRLFSLTEAERTRLELEPVLAEAVGNRKKMADLDQRLSALSNRIHLMGGLQVRFEKAAELRRNYEQVTARIKAALEQIEATGCVVKDLDMGLLDFPARLNGEDVYLCWRLGEDRIRFYHRPDEGFAGRKPLDPRDAGGEPPVQ